VTTTFRQIIADDPSRPLVSCLMVTSGRREALRIGAVTDWKKQTWPHRELVVVVDDGDTPLGALRQASIEDARGEYICQWDDDDRYAPERIEAQLEAIDPSRSRWGVACCLCRWTLENMLTGERIVSHRRNWEGSLLAVRELLPPYEREYRRGEDTALLVELCKRRPGALVLLDRPDLYTYRFHGGNTFGEQHFEGLCRAARAAADVIG
jgi:hypothetical protein